MAKICSKYEKDFNDKFYKPEYEMVNITIYIRPNCEIDVVKFVYYKLECSQELINYVETTKKLCEDEIRLELALDTI